MRSSVGRVGVWVVGVVLIGAVGWIESSFDRPPLSARPQVWLSKPVVWSFRFDGALTRIVESPADGGDELVFEALDPVAQRFKNGSPSPEWAPIQVDVLLETLSDVDPEWVQAWVSGSAVAERIGGRPSARDGLLVLSTSARPPEVVSDDSLSETFAIEILVTRGECEPRESRVWCPFADFAGADLSRGDFDGANLRGADLNGVDFSGAKLAAADLTGAFGVDVRMARARLIGINVRNAFLDRVDYTDAVWTW